MTTTTQDRDLQLPGGPEHTPRGHLGLIVVGIVGYRTRRCLGAGRRPVHPGERERAHGRGAPGLCPRLGVAGRAVGPVQQPTSALGGCAGRVHGGGRCHFTPSAGLRRPGCVRLGVAASPVRAGCLDVHSGPTTAAQPRRTVAAVSGPGSADGGLRRRRLPDGAPVDRYEGLSDARPAGRRGRAPDAPSLHRLGQPHGHPGTGSGRGLLRLWLGRAHAGPGQHSVRI